MKVGSGETYGDVGEEDEEENYDEEDWEDLEDWRVADPPISVSSKWSNLPHCPPPPRLMTNHVSHR